MPVMSTYLADQLIRHVFGPDMFTKPASLYLALFLTPTDDEGGGTEVMGNNYVRQPVSFVAAGGGTVSSDGLVQFPAALPMGWGTVTHWAIYDAVAGGNRLVHGPLSEQKGLNPGDRMEFAPGSIILTFD